MTQTNRNVLLAVIAAVVAAGAFYMLALKPKRAEIAKLDTEVTEAQKQLDDARTLLASNEAARDQFSKAYAAVVRLGKAVPADDDVRSLVVQLDAAARRTKVDFRSINVGTGAGAQNAEAAQPGATAAPLPPGATIGPAGFPIMPFSFAFEGSFFRLGEFFAELESFVKDRNKQIDVTGRLLTLDSLELTPDADGFPNIRATVGATSFLVSPLEGLTGGATAAGPAGQAAGAAGATPAPATPNTASPAPAPSTATSTGALR